MKRDFLPGNITPKDILPVALMFLCTAVSFRMTLKYENPQYSLAAYTEQAATESNAGEVTECSEEEKMVIAALKMEKTGGANKKLELIENNIREKAEARELRIAANPTLWLVSLQNENGENYADQLLKELTSRDASFFGHIYDLGAGSVSNEMKKSVSINFLDGDGKTGIAISNAQVIVAMTSVYGEACGISDWNELREYALNLWKQSHSSSESSEVTYCDGCGDEDDSEIETSAEATSSEAIAESLASGSNAESSTAGGSGTSTKENTCPGHLKISVTGKIHGMDESSNLFTLDNKGQQAAQDGTWDGWTEESINKVRTLCDQDWAAKYGIQFQVYEAKTPLSNAQISSYMNMLPEDISDERKAIIEFALQSVGRVPYYWGGKPSTSGYAGNNFGATMPPDSENRTVKGLDCSGWVSWVYWSATGNRLPFEGTAGLCSLGRGVSLDELKPGDIAIDTGSDSHIVIYLGKSADGTRLCIHESSYAGTVAVSSMSNDWEYYRNIFD